jgi:hypothetical protein
MPVPPAATFSIGIAGARRSGLLPGRTREHETWPSTSYGVSGSMLIAMVNRGRISFHEEQDLTRGTRYAELLTLFLRGAGVE